MESYSHFFPTLYDEKSPTGYLGAGTHASILRAIVFHDPALKPLTRGTSTDFAIIWDEDHDTRIIDAVESIYRAGFLGSFLMIGEREGSLNAIVVDHLDPKLMISLEEKLRGVAHKREGDPWTSSVRRLDGPNHKIIDDLDHKVTLYLMNLKMLWRLGMKQQIASLGEIDQGRKGREAV